MAKEEDQDSGHAGNLKIENAVSYVLLVVSVVIIRSLTYNKNQSTLLPECLELW